MGRLFVAIISVGCLVACARGADTVAASSETASPRAAGSAGSAGSAGVTASTGASGSSAIEPAADHNTEYRDVTIPAGTVLAVDLETSVGSDTSRVEQPVRGALRRPLVINGARVLPVGTAIHGHVTTARRPGRVKGRGLIAMRFTELDTPVDGRTRIRTATVSRMAPATKQKDALEIIAPAAGGAVIGRVAGGKDAARKGAVIGGGAGTAYVLSTRGKEIRLGKGANLAVRLTAPLTLRVPVRK